MAASASIWHDDPAWSSEDFWFLMAYRLSHGFYLIVMDSYKKKVDLARSTRHSRPMIGM